MVAAGRRGLELVVHDGLQLLLRVRQDLWLRVCVTRVCVGVRDVCVWGCVCVCAVCMVLACVRAHAFE